MKKANLTTLVDARKKAGLKQGDLAKLLGLTQPTVCQWEKGYTVPSGPARLLLAQTFRVPVEVVASWFERAA